MNVKEKHRKYLDEMDWPPVVLVTNEEGKDEEVELDDLDIAWTLCTILKMKWKDALGVTDEFHKKFLYNKAMIFAETFNQQHQELADKKKIMDDAFDKKVEEMKNTSTDMQSDMMNQLNL